MKTIRTIFSLLIVFLSLTATAQDARPKIKYGDVKPEDFEPKVYAVDSAAEAVYLYDAGSSIYVGNTSGSFNVVYTKHARIHLLNKNSFELATIKIPIYNDANYKESIDDLNATTYNIENGKVTITKLDKASVFKEKGDNYITNKFTFPNLKEGSIIEYESLASC